MADPSLEELLQEQRRRELARLEEEARRRQALVTPRELPTAAAAPVTFAPEDVVEAERRTALEEEARRRVAEPGVFLPRGTSVVEAEREELRKLEANLNVVGREPCKRDAKSRPRSRSAGFRSSGRRESAKNLVV